MYAPSPKGAVAGQWNGQDDPEQARDEIERKYTPTTSDDDLGHVDLVIKVYRPGKTYVPRRDRFCASPCPITPSQAVENTNNWL